LRRCITILHVSRRGAAALEETGGGWTFRVPSSSTTVRNEESQSHLMSRARKTDAQRYEELKSQIVDIPPIRRGSVVRRFMPCGKPGCRCQAQQPQLHGPYYQWTRKIEGKTATTRVDKEQAKLLSEWIQNGRRLDSLVGQMEKVSLRLTERLLHRARGP